MKIIGLDMEELFTLQIVHLKKSNFPAEIIDLLRSKKDAVLGFAQQIADETIIPFAPAIPQSAMRWTKQMSHFMGSNGRDETEIYAVYNGFAYNEEKTVILNRQSAPYFMLGISLLPAELPVDTTWEKQVWDARNHLTQNRLTAMNHLEATSFAFMDREFDLATDKWQQLCALSTSWDGYEIPGIYRGRDWPVGIDWVNLQIVEGKLSIKPRRSTEPDQLKIPVYRSVA